MKRHGRQGSSNRRKGGGVETNNGNKQEASAICRKLQQHFRLKRHEQRSRRSRILRFLWRIDQECDTYYVTRCSCEGADDRPTIFFVA